MYCKKWFVELNPIKTVYQLSGSQIFIPDILLFYEGYRLQRVKHFRYLGYEINTRASYGTFLQQILINISGIIFRYK